MTATTAHKEVLHEEHEDHLPFLMGIVCVICYILAGHCIDYYGKKGHVIVLHESVIAVIVGAICGIVQINHGGAAVSFNTDIFWNLILPPIIFAQGYTLKKRNFFKFFPQISIFGVLGTMMVFMLVAVSAHYVSRMSWVLEGGCSKFLFISEGSGNDDDSSNNNGLIFKPLTWMESLLLSAVLSASDEVSALSHIKPEKSPVLGSILFGEGVVNDALSILLFKTIYSNFLQNHGDKGIAALFPIIAGDAIWKLVVASLIGILCGLMASRIQFINPSLKSDHIREICNVLLFGYLAYAWGEYLDVSGILALFFAGTTLAHYCWHNISKSSQENTKVTFHMISMICEAIAFVYVGISAVSMEGIYSLRFSFVMFFILCFSRLFTISILTVGLNVSSKSFNFTWQQALGLSAAGMVRGSISWAQALKIGMMCPIITTTTLLVVLLSTMVFGVLLPPLIKGLGLSQQLDHRPTLNHIGALNHTMENSESSNIMGTLNTEDNTEGLYNSNQFSKIEPKESAFYRSCITRFRALDDSFMKHYFGGRKRKGIDSRRNSYHQNEASTFHSRTGSVSLALEDPLLKNGIMNVPEDLQDKH